MITEVICRTFQQPAHEPLFEKIDCAEMARRWGVSESWVRNHVRPGCKDMIPHRKLGSNVVFEWGIEALNAYWDRCKRGYQALSPIEAPISEGSLHFNQAPMHEGVSPHLLTYIERVYFPNLTRTKLNTPTELNRGEFHLDPVTSTKRPKARAKEETYAYSIEEELIVLDAFKDNRRSLAAISLVSWSGVSRSELEGLRWEDRREGHLHIARSVVEGAEGDQDSASQGRGSHHP